jgi:hypothetical protein
LPRGAALDPAAQQSPASHISSRYGGCMNFLNGTSHFKLKHPTKYKQKIKLPLEKNMGIFPKY